MVYIEDGVPGKEESVSNEGNDIEIKAIDINLHRVKWFILGIYRPPSQQEQYFFNETTKILDQYCSTFNKANKNLGDFISSRNSENDAKSPTCPPIEQRKFQRLSPIEITVI